MNLKPGRSGIQPAELLERETAMERIVELVDAAATAADGALLGILGGPGEGKTALLRETCRIAGEHGMTVLRARGSELEQSFALGAARQLLEPAVRALDPTTREELLQGAASLAANVLDLHVEQPPANPAAVLHGLYWLIAGLSERTPVLLALDDAHWADSATLQWLAYLSARLEGLPLLVAFAARPDPIQEWLLPMGESPLFTQLHVQALSEAAVRELAERTLEIDLEDTFAAELHRISAGNPFALHQLLVTLAGTDAQPDIDALRSLGERPPAAVRDDVTRRLQRLGSEAVAVAQAMSVLGDQAVPRQLATLAELELERTVAALDALAREAIVGKDTTAYLHPLIHSAVYEEIGARRRARLHARAAALLIEDGADPEAVAAHLLRSDPEGSLESVKSLRTAAGSTLRRGDAAPAVTYLTRALAEPAPPSERPGLLAELGQAEILMRSPAAIEHLRDAMELSEDVVQRVRLRWTLADTIFFAGGWEQAVAELDRAIAELGDLDPDLALRLEGRLITLRTLDGRGVTTAAPRHGSEDEHLQRLRERADAASLLDGARPLRLNLALLLAARGRPPAELAPLIEHGLDDGRFLELESADAIEAVHGAFALVLSDRLDEAHAHTSAMLADAAARGSLLGFLAGATFRALTNLRRGALTDADADAVPALALAREHQLHFTIPFIASYLGLTLLERGRAEQARELLTALPVPPNLAGTPAGITLLEARGRAHLACGEQDLALESLRACGEACALIGVVNPNIVAWRSELAVILREQAPDHARQLVAAELADARRAGVARGIGVALRASAMFGAATEREALLEESIATLESSPARLELAHSLVDLGAHLRRGGERTRAREPLLKGLELAHVTRAEALAERAREELAAAGARPRRPWLTGVDALTPSELRVARMAADGATNQQVAQALFITTQTVKGHLSVVYRKLSIESRRELPAALAAHKDA